MSRRFLVAGCIFMSVVVLAFAGLLGRSRWQGDEYITLAWMFRLGRVFLVHWYVVWSPRLWSDLLFAVYGAAVHRFHRPLAGTCMAVLWIGLMLAAVLPALRAARGAWLRRAFVGLSILALCLVGHGVAQVFFWPAGGLAYLPTLAGIIWLFWLAADGIAGPRRFGAAAALTLTAGSSEVGAFFTAALCACTTVWFGVSSASRSRTPLVWLIPGLIVTLVDLGLVVRGRVATLEVLSPGNPTLHHVLPSLLGAPSLLWSQITSGGPTSTPYVSSPVRIAARLLVLLGARWCLSPTIRRVGPRDTMLLIPFSAACVLAVFLSLLAALYQFGGPCCERHDAMRECLLTLACLGMGAWSATMWPPRVPATGVLPIVLAVALLGARQGLQMPGEYVLYPATVSARAHTWQSGLAHKSAMELVPMPSGAIVTGDGFTAGTHDVSDTSSWSNTGVMLFFGKTRLTIVAR